MSDEMVKLTQEQQRSAALLERLAAAGFSFQIACDGTGFRVSAPEGIAVDVELDTIVENLQGVTEIVSHGLIPWTPEGIKEIFDFSDSLMQNSPDDWPELRTITITMMDVEESPEAAPTYTFNKFSIENQIAAYLMEKYGAILGMAHLYRFFNISEFLGEHRSSLIRDGWVVDHDCGKLMIHVALQQALAELHYSSDGIMVRDALARARELSEA